MQVKNIMFQKQPFYVWTAICLFFGASIFLFDFINAYYKQYSFYLSESLLFSTFWWMFIPLVYGQVIVFRTNKAKSWIPVTVFLFSIFHILLFPGVVWALSGLFYDHTYSYAQTFGYVFEEFSLTLLVIYAIPVIVLKYLDINTEIKATKKDIEPNQDTQVYITELVVTHKLTNLCISTDQIAYISANTPYINIHLESQKYLHRESLKNIAELLDPLQFVRIHKSTIINLNYVSAYITRKNGDYDIDLKGQTILRLSRNYAAEFKAMIKSGHHLAVI
ncbi:MAG: LytTR family DNA-binding domain-containing protein [Saprospiraceae bacterium]